MAPAGSKVTLDPATFMLSNKRLIGCTEGDSVPYEVGVIHLGCFTGFDSISFRYDRSVIDS